MVEHTVHEWKLLKPINITSPNVNEKVMIHPEKISLIFPLLVAIIKKINVT